MLYRLLTTIITALLATHLYSQNASAQTAIANLESSHLIPGEPTILWLSLQNKSPDGRPQVPEVKEIAINFIQPVVQLNTNGELITHYAYRVSAPNPGKYTIPPITLTSQGKLYTTQPISFQVHPTSVLHSIPNEDRNKDIKIAWFPTKTTLFQREICPLTLKVYVPTRQRIANFGLPTPTKKNNIHAWRFSTPRRPSPNTVSIEGENYQIISYSTTLNSETAGTAIFGPTKLRLIIQKSIIDRRFGPRIIESPLHLHLPELTLNILPLPSNAPANFQGAVGTFQISAQCPKIQLKETDSTKVILHVDGTGNLPSIQAPTLNDKTWTIINTDRPPRGKERRNATGRVTFHQLIRPSSSAATTIPSYTFSYFDPDAKKYHTLKTPPIPVRISSEIEEQGTTQSPIARPDFATPPEKMQDILGIIKSPKPQRKTTQLHNTLLFHLTPALIACLLIGIAVYQRHKTYLRLHPNIQAKKSAIKELANTSDTATFYRQAGRIIDQWHHSDTQQPQLQEILAERDSICFKPESSAVQNITQERKKNIIKILKRTIQITILTCSILITFSYSIAHADSSKRASDAWEKENYQQALKIYQDYLTNSEQPSTDTLYNIGNCYYKLNQPGLAALTWRQALHNDPTHLQARKNLRYLELKQNANVPEYQPWQTQLALIKPTTYTTLLYASIWIISLSTLALILFHKKKVALIPTIIAICLATIIGINAGFARYYYPNDHLFAPPKQQAVITTTTLLFHEAHRLTPSSTHLPATSLIRVNEQRGPWTHITTSNKTNGWIESKNLYKILDQ